MSFTKEKYLNEVRSELKKELNLTNDFMIPRLEKIVLNCTTGDAMHDKKVAQSLLDDLTTIAGQKAIATKAKKSISAFKVREGADIGAKVTLRKDKMYEFLDRFIYMALPRTRDFRGLSRKGFDGKGNYSLGVKEQIVFFEINYDKIEKIRGLNITICTTARDDKEAYALLKKLNFPFNS